MSFADEAAKVPRPVQGRVYRVATSSTTNTFDVPDAWKGHYCRFLATGDTCQIAFSSGTASDLTFNQASTTASDPDTITPVDGSGITLVKDVPEHFIVQTNDETFEAISDATGGFLEVIVSDGIGEAE